MIIRRFVPSICVRLVPSRLYVCATVLVSDLVSHTSLPWLIFYRHLFNYIN